MDGINDILIKRAIREGKSVEDLLSDNKSLEKYDSLFSSDKNIREEEPTCYFSPKPEVILDKRGERDNFIQNAIKSIFSGTGLLPDETTEDLKEGFDYKITDDDEGYITVKKRDGDKIKKSRFYSYNDAKYDINGEIDTEVKQGQMEDCGLISLIYSMGQSDKGKEIIKNAITPNYNENNEQDGYNVYFKGLDETYKITQSEIDGALNKQLEYFMDKSKYFYAKGDKDMVLFEIAWNKCCENNSEALNNIKSQSLCLFSDEDFPEGLSGTYQYKLFYALTGADFYENPRMDDEVKELSDTLNQQRKEAIEKQLSETNEFKLSDFSIDQESISCINTEGERYLELNSTDSYEIINENSDDGTVTLKNKNTDKNYYVSKNDLIDTMVKMASSEESAKIFDLEYQRALESDVVTLGISSKCSVTDINGKQIRLTSGHAYGVKSINENQIILVNPWDTSEETVLSKEELKKAFTSDVSMINKFNFHYGKIEE